MIPLDYWSFANWLCTNCTTTAGFRSSASRAYYAAFHTGLTLLEAMNIRASIAHRVIKAVWKIPYTLFEVSQEPIRQCQGCHGFFFSLCSCLQGSQPPTNGRPVSVRANVAARLAIGKGLRPA